MKKNLRNRVLAAILTGTMGLPLAACDEAAIRKEAEEEESKVINTIDENNQKNLEELYKKIEILLEDKDNASKDDLEHLLDEIKKAQATTTYTTELTQTTMTEPTVLTNATTVTSVNPTTVSATNTTSNTQTTGTTTTTVAVQLNNENNEPEIESGNTEHFFAEKRYTISDEYIVKGENKGEGLYLYSIVRKLNNGIYNEEIAQEIKKLNTLKGDYVAEGTKLTVPFTLVYCKGISAEDVAAYSEVSLEEIKKLNGISDSKEEVDYQKGLLIKSLNKDQRAYETETGKIQNIMYGTVISGDKVIECTNTYKEDSLVGFIIINRTSKYENTVNYMELSKDGYRSEYLIAKNVNIDKTKASDGNAVIACNNQTEIYSYGIEEGKEEENYRTLLYKQTLTNEYYMHRSADGTVAVTLNNINVPGFEQYNVIGGKQKTK